MTILTATELRTHIETDLADAALNRLAAAAEQLIIREAGDTAALTEIFNEEGFPQGRERTLFLARTTSSITSIKERDTYDGTQTTLSADDYRQEGGRKLVRLTDGTNSRSLWAPHTEVIYVPATDSNIRELVQINLVTLANMYIGAKQEQEGDFDFEHLDFAPETRKILSLLNNSNNRMLVV
ncbi:hypothetical protein LCGC14_0746940 [marine sediment metagenome]|uniref:Phage gp6-like head-tail connector protein n=1 Tax=marine sediment metagenome TaxID=412755 RepID=A0A0F9TC77_9ZZZZ